MRVKVALTSFALALAAHSCAGVGQNTLPVFTEQKGSITLSVVVPPEQSDVTSVAFTVDGEAVGTDTEGPDWTAQFDTTKVADGIHIVRALGNPGAGDITLLENSIVVRNTTTSPTGGAVSGTGEAPAEAAP